MGAYSAIIPPTLGPLGRFCAIGGMHYVNSLFLPQRPLAEDGCSARRAEDKMPALQCRGACPATAAYREGWIGPDRHTGRSTARLLHAEPAYVAVRAFSLSRHRGPNLPQVPMCGARALPCLPSLRPLSQFGRLAAHTVLATRCVVALRSGSRFMGIPCATHAAYHGGIRRARIKCKRAMTPIACR